MTLLTAGPALAASHIGCEAIVTIRTGQQSADGPLLATEPEFNAKVVTPVLVDVRPLMSRMPPSMRPGSAKMIFPTSATLLCHRLEQLTQEALALGLSPRTPSSPKLMNSCRLKPEQRHLLKSQAVK